ncbi:MAG: hypothetical protein ACXWVD_00160 [Telluria sp.]
MSRILTGLDDHAASTCANDMIIAKEIGDTLHNHYPGHLWAVEVDGPNGVANIRDLMLSGRMGYVLRLVDIYSASEFKKNVIRAGGELLERYRLNRGAFDEAQYSGLKTNFAGDFAFDK